jgi:DNA-binding LytR/AlgR family response regulator
MIKIIWRKEDHQALAEALTKDHGISIVTDLAQMDEQHIGILIDDKDYDQVKPILENIIKAKHLMFFETKDGWTQIDIREVTHIESFGDDIYVHTKDQDVHIVRTPLYQLEEKLSSYDVIRISKSFMVNVIHIKYIRTTLYGKLDLQMTDGTHLEVTRSFVKSFKQSLGL